MTGRERILRIVRRAQWVVLPLLVVALAELLVRSTADRVPRWYAAADRLAADHALGALFVGSSRVQAAILPSAFLQALAERGQKTGIALNLGRGYSTDPEHYLGLRNLIAAHPAALRGVTVFAEAPGGYAYDTRWDVTAWAIEPQPWLLVDLMRLRDLPRFWRQSGLGFETRVHLTVRVLLRRLALFNRRERVREQWLDDILPTVAARRIPVFPPPPRVGDDLQGPMLTSIRTDPQALAVARELARGLGEQMSAFQAPVREWRGTIPEAMARLVRDAGGRLVFFEPPQSDVFMKGYRTAVRREDAAEFARQAREWGACVVRPAFGYTDDDLPDLWHLRPERVAEYTRAVALTWLDTCSPTSPSS